MYKSHEPLRVLYKLYNSSMAPLGHTPDPFGRIARVPWGALRHELASAAIDRVLDGAPAEREIDRTLRAHRDLTRDERTALVEAIFGVALWRRRLVWNAIHGRREPGRLADRWSLPDWLEAHLEHELGDEADAFCAAVAVPGPICLRANRLLTTRGELAERLELPTRPAPRARDALLVEAEKPNLFGSQAWREGLFEVQDEGSQLVGELVQVKPGETVLDLCAGAGGKSLQLAASGALVLAYDIGQSRLDRLRSRARRARAADRIEIVKAPAPADKVLVDAPCSELGTLRRGPDARWRIDASSLKTWPPIQAALLETAAANTRKRLVYATCTINRAENEEIADAFDRAHPEFRRAETLTLLPHRDGTDGFFAAAWDRR